MYRVAVIGDERIFNNLNGLFQVVEPVMLDDLPREYQDIVFLKIANDLRWGTQRRMVERMIKNNSIYKHRCQFITMEGHTRRNIVQQFPELNNFKIDLCRVGFPQKYPIYFWSSMKLPSMVCGNNCRFSGSKRIHDQFYQSQKYIDEYAYSKTLLWTLIQATKIVRFSPTHYQI